MTLGGCAFAWSNGNIGRRQFFWNHKSNTGIQPTKLFLHYYIYFFSEWCWSNDNEGGFVVRLISRSPSHSTSPLLQRTHQVFPRISFFPFYFFLISFFLTLTSPLLQWTHQVSHFTLFLSFCFLFSFALFLRRTHRVSHFHSLSVCFFPHLIFSPPFSFSNHFSFLFLSLLFSCSYPTMQQT